MNTLANNLKANRLKVTPQRLAIYTYLLSTTEHPTVEMIYNSIKDEYPAMSLATVYKTVASLRNAHLIKEFNIGEDSNRYDGNVDFHSHLLCTKCHMVYDYFGDINISKSCNDIQNDLNFSIANFDVNFYGVCSNCLENE